MNTTDTFTVPAQGRHLIAGVDVPKAVYERHDQIARRADVLVGVDGILASWERNGGATVDNVLALRRLISPLLDDHCMEPR